MPITEELKTAQELRDAGLTQRAAELLAAKLEVTAQATRDVSFRDMQTEMKAFRAEMNSRFDALSAQVSVQIAEHKADTEKSLRSLQTVLPGAIFSAVGVSIAIMVALKIF